MQGVVHLFGVVQAHRTSSNLLEPHHYRDSRACRVYSYEFWVVRPCRTFSMYIFTGQTRFAGCLCTSSGWFKSIEPHRTFLNHIISEIAGHVVFVRMSSEWFDCTDAYALVRGSKCIEPPRTFLNNIIAERARCVIREGSVQSKHPELM